MLGDHGIPIEDKPTQLCQRFHPHKNDAGYFIAAFQRTRLAATGV
jgi:hypothetical protein